MKILIIMPYFFEPHRWMISGYKTALYLSKKNKVIVLTTGRPYYEEMGPNLRIYRMWDFFMPDPVNFSIVPGLFWHLCRVIKKEKPDIFLVNKHMFYTSLAVIWLRLLGKKVFTQIDSFPGITWFSRSIFVNMILWIYGRTIGLCLLKLSQKVILLHEGLIPIARKYQLNYTVVHNGVDLGAIKKAKPASDLRSKSKGEQRVIYVGRLESVKGYRDYLRIAVKMVRKNPHLKFYLVGNTQGKEDLIKKYSSRRLIFLGHRNDVYSILKTMDVFVLSSYSEGLPNALMEAMASGLACVASNVGGVKVLIKDKINGLLFEPGNCQAMESKITLLLLNDKLRKKLSYNAHKTISKDYSWKKVASQYLGLFEEKAPQRNYNEGLD